MARSSLDNLLDYLDTRNVIHVDLKKIGSLTQKEIEELASPVYIAAKLALVIRQDADKLLPSYSNKGEGHKKLSLNQAIKARFILAELYTALGIRAKKAKAHYTHVIEEGRKLFKRLQETAEMNGKPVEFYREMVRIAHDIGASYKRRHDLDNPNQDKYGIDNYHDTLRRAFINPQYKEARTWYRKMAHLVIEHRLQNISPILRTGYEFKRYLEDIMGGDKNKFGLGVPCMYSDSDGRALKILDRNPDLTDFQCVAPNIIGSKCEYNAEGVCNLLGGLTKLDEATTIEVIKERLTSKKRHQPI